MLNMPRQPVHTNEAKSRLPLRISAFRGGGGYGRGSLLSCSHYTLLLATAILVLISAHAKSALLYDNNDNNSNDNNNNNTNNKNLLPPSHAAHTKTLQKQMFGPKSLNQRQPTATIHTSATTWTTPSVPMTTPILVGAHTGFSMPSILAPLRPTTPTALSVAPVVPPVVDITQLGTLV